jgi:hypothetical protein
MSQTQQQQMTFAADGGVNAEQQRSQYGEQQRARSPLPQEAVPPPDRGCACRSAGQAHGISAIPAALAVAVLTMWMARVRRRAGL